VLEIGSALLFPKLFWTGRDFLVLLGTSALDFELLLRKLKLLQTFFIIFEHRQGGDRSGTYLVFEEFLLVFLLL
jgi:hypothetical protein